ncbi:hypothetical protein HaLaN_09235 [Haematococcus lacustris]|uniref:Uncharacterized protein n=1 Tax=Haematococcus lacustris TaxID=44745 RepID=A0A699YVZ0_HAELA|nr:hypothetical protein HaLaN_09235 [Haematococcus lacustris]
MVNPVPRQALRLAHRKQNVYLDDTYGLQQLWWALSMGRYDFAKQVVIFLRRAGIDT